MADKSVYEGFFHRVEDLARARGMNTGEACTRAKLDPATFTAMKRRTTEPKYSIVVNLARVLGVTPDYLFYGDAADKKLQADVMHELKTAAGLTDKDRELLTSLVKNLVETFVDKRAEAK